MNSREKFVRGELEKIYNLLNVSYEYSPYSMLQDDKRFVRIFELLLEINEKATFLKQAIKVHYLILVLKEIEKKMDVRTLKDFDKEIRTKINHELELERKRNEYLARILLVGEYQLWEKIRIGYYSWPELPEDKKARLFKKIGIYSSFQDLVENVKSSSFSFFIYYKARNVLE